MQCVSETNQEALAKTWDFLIMLFGRGGVDRCFPAHQEHRLI